ncbi:hypothetical protein PUN28_005764 [Cardiocondyla obscurior]|uniref:Uncharacterized protein n=1 Tax=Cardiocondyla obscurior TaxID=286306 RepID=A0AAW2GAE5_9HYME
MIFVIHEVRSTAGSSQRNGLVEHDKVNVVDRGGGLRAGFGLLFTAPKDSFPVLLAPNSAVFPHEPLAWIRGNVVVVVHKVRLFSRLLNGPALAKCRNSLNQFRRKIRRKTEILECALYYFWSGRGNKSGDELVPKRERKRDSGPFTRPIVGQRRNGGKIKRWRVV